MTDYSAWSEKDTAAVVQAIRDGLAVRPSVFMALVVDGLASGQLVIEPRTNEEVQDE